MFFGHKAHDPSRVLFSAAFYDTGLYSVLLTPLPIPTSRSEYLFFSIVSHRVVLAPNPFQAVSISLSTGFNLYIFFPDRIELANL